MQRDLIWYKKTVILTDSSQHAEKRRDVWYAKGIYTEYEIDEGWDGWVLSIITKPLLMRGDSTLESAQAFLQLMDNRTHY